MTQEHDLTDAELEFNARAEHLAGAIIDVIGDEGTPATIIAAFGLVLFSIAGDLEEEQAGSGKALLRAFSGAWTGILGRLDH
jgi:hypothetical protein